MAHRRRIYGWNNFAAIIAGLVGGLGMASCQSASAPTVVDSLQPTVEMITQATIAPFNNVVPVGAPLAQPSEAAGGGAIADPLLTGSDASDDFDDRWTLTMYTPDATCDRLVPQGVVVQGDRPIEVAVGRVLVEVASDNLDIRGYRLQVDTQTRTATVALRLRPGTTHRFKALSSCEQLTLFGSLRKTLTDNPQWPIDQVTFTDGSKTIRL